MRITSPKGYSVEELVGNAGDIADRGRQIVEIGDMLTTSTDVIQRMVSEGAEMSGKSVEKLREACKEISGTIGQAATLYTQVGPYVRDYGIALAPIQAAINPLVDEVTRYVTQFQAAEEHWRSVASQSVDYPQATGDAAADNEARQNAETAHNRAVSDAAADVEVWRQKAADAAYAYDAQYDTWLGEFEAAANGIHTACDDGIQDGWRDDLDGFVDFMLKVLQVAGLVLAVLGMIIGGPIIAALAAIVAIATLVLTIYAYARGNASGWDLAFAIIGVIPFGQLGKFADGGSGVLDAYKSWAGLSGGMAGFADDAARWGRGANAMRNGDSFLDVMRNGVGSADGVGNIVTEPLKDEALAAWRAKEGVGGLGEFLTGLSDGDWATLTKNDTGGGALALGITDVFASFHLNVFALPYEGYDAARNIVDIGRSTWKGRS